MSQSATTGAAELTATFGPVQMSLLLSSDTSGLPRINCFNILEAAISLDADGLLSFRIKPGVYFNSPFPTGFFKSQTGLSM